MRLAQFKRTAVAGVLLIVGGVLWSQFHRDAALFLILFLERYIPGSPFHIFMWVLLYALPVVIGFYLVAWAVRGFADEAD